MHFLTDSHQPLPRTLRILGTTVSLHKIAYKPKVIQCTNCFQWHNARTCSRRPYCRICGSNQHAKAKHTPNCIALSPYQCLAKCLYCGGPHPADDCNCPFRLTLKGPPKTKLQVEAITRDSKAAKSRAVAIAKCCRAPIIDVLMEEHLIYPTTPRTLVRNYSLDL
jgi:hypothetical protein